ncbi:hypothetical protein Tco_0772210 [Tanacetum coccineum]|uniref:DUF4283 domain-containing protein n=1 Tax=Tanacetum coccineum TaxID=301880 RepID=A0ABQ4ZHA4_9ASTR
MVVTGWGSLREVLGGMVVGVRVGGFCGEVVLSERKEGREKNSGTVIPRTPPHPHTNKAHAIGVKMDWPLFLGGACLDGELGICARWNSMRISEETSRIRFGMEKEACADELKSGVKVEELDGWGGGQTKGNGKGKGLRVGEKILFEIDVTVVVDEECEWRYVYIEGKEGESRKRDRRSKLVRTCPGMEEGFFRVDSGMPLRDFRGGGLKIGAFFCELGLEEWQGIWMLESKMRVIVGGDGSILRGLGWRYLIDRGKRGVIGVVRWRIRAMGGGERLKRDCEERMG